MALSYIDAEQAFDNDDFKSLYEDKNGLRFLKLRSLFRASRPDYIKAMTEKVGIDKSSISRKDTLKALFNSSLSDKDIEDTINSIYSAEREERKQVEDNLISELYKLKAFNWGGIYQNDLRRHIVDRFVKMTVSFDELSTRIENELYHSIREYALCSWYNHWTSIIIEDIFKDHKRVLPAVGQIKKVDFFIDNTPFDLKVTYLPEGFIASKRKAMGKSTEISLLKKLSREIKITYDQKLPTKILLEDLWIKAEYHPNNAAKELIADLRKTRFKILDDCLDDSGDLLRWLYENQGSQRFDASNRLFLILIDRDNFFESWKLKRAKDMLASEINVYLDKKTNNPGREVTFNWNDGNEYTAHSADVIFIKKEI